MPFISFEAIQQTQQGQHKTQYQDLTRIHSDPPALSHDPSIRLPPPFSLSIFSLLFFSFWTKP